jgi:hypothetical protein
MTIRNDSGSIITHMNLLKHPSGTAKTDVNCSDSSPVELPVDMNNNNKMYVTAHGRSLIDGSKICK